MILSPPTLTQRLRQTLRSSVEYDLTPYRERLLAIERCSERLLAADETELAASAATFRRRACDGEGLDLLLDETFALVREVAGRRLGLRPFDEQILAGVAMHRGRIAEMQTGEGKTLAAVAPVALHALREGGVHVLTVNDYLAHRDAEWMGPIYRFFGLSVGVVRQGLDAEERRAAYACDVTYLTATESGFDFLRDRLCLDAGDLVHRSPSFALVDEADSILIDEARIPLVIAGDVEEVGSDADRVAALARDLVAGSDFDTDEHSHNVFLTETGAERAERELECANLFSAQSALLLADLRNALHAEHLLQRDVDYLVRDGRVELIDDFTGRIAQRRQWPDGLQAAIEAKERLQLQKEGRILGSITLQHFLSSCERLAGMTATAVPAAGELDRLYGLGVTVVPTHRPCVRLDRRDRVFTHRAAKERALIEEITRVHRSARPVLVGTASVEESERLASELVEAGVASKVLNAKNDALEAEIVAGAGALGAVTVSTNMAGRGTDIRLGGPDESQREEVLALGGLYVIGTNRHESVRVDRQLRGRAGRQGDPGESRFFVSLEDPLLQRYGVRGLISTRFLPEKQESPIDDPVVRGEIARVQRIVEGENAVVRRRLGDYSEPVEKQRQHVHDWRQRALRGEATLHLLGERSEPRYRQLRSEIGPELFHEIERRITLLVIDRCWSDHLAEVQRIRDGIHVVSLVGKDPLAEFYREIGPAFATLQQRIDDEIVRTFEAVTITASGVDWEREGLVGPSSTWTYLVSDQPFGSNPLRDLANRAGVALWGSLLLGPFIFLWALYMHLQRWRKRRTEGRTSAPGG